MVNNGIPLHVQASRLVYHTLNGETWISKLVPPLLLLLDAALCALIIWRVPYTEIDWRAYMEQISQVVSGERVYTEIQGGTGPLVYPAAHVYIYTGLYYLTNHGQDILLAQQIFAGLYLATLAAVMSCYWRAKAPPYVFPMLVLSKRLHSIFMLRCFNDCFAAFFFWLAIWLLQRRRFTAGALVYSWGIGVKMSLLLALPVVGLIILLSKGPAAGIAVAYLMLQVQLLIAIPFLKASPGAYLGRAFELSRQFLFKWTVNWRFLGNRIFLSREFSITLLVVHASVLLTFLVTRWLPPSGKSLADVIWYVLRPAGRTPIMPGFTPRYILTTILTANIIGMLFARSLHYQFYAYLGWSTPFLLWRGGIHPVLQYILWALQEWAWLVFPSTPASSAVAVGVMAITISLVWLGTGDEAAAPPLVQAAGAAPGARRRQDKTTAYSTLPPQASPSESLGGRPRGSGSPSSAL